MRYIIADENHELWGHIFDEDGTDRERMCRFVYDADEEALHKLEIWRDQGWSYASRSEMEDLEDSLKNANPDALDNPAGWNLGVADELPDWAGSEITAAP